MDESPGQRSEEVSSQQRRKAGGDDDGEGDGEGDGTDAGEKIGAIVFRLIHIVERVLDGGDSDRSGPDGGDEPER